MVFCCKIFLGGAHFHALFVQKFKELKGKSNFLVVIDYLQCILLKLCILGSNLEITAICHNLNFYEIYALFGVNSFHLNSKLCKN